MKWKRALSLLMGGILLAQTGLIHVSAEEKDSSARENQLEEAAIGSDIWDTPVIPDAAAEIPGISETEINLNETTGDGTWKFLYDIPDYTDPDGVPYPTEENQNFDFDAWSEKNWKAIKVPGEAVMQGFDIQTNNEYYYQREITIPEDFEGNNILVRFDGVYCNARVWIDGQYIRTHVGGFTTWDCDITEYAKPGETVTITVGVADLYSDTRGIWNPEGEMMNNPSNATEYAHHNIGGILRDVSLVALPRDYIARTYVNTDLDENFVDADLEVTAQLEMESEEASLTAELLDGEDVVVSGEMDFRRQEDGMSQAQKLTMAVTDPEKWDAEHPNLYTLRTTLEVDGKTVQVNEEKIGFREIQYGGMDGTDGNKVYVNGREVKLRGTCRHDVSDDLGRSMTREEAYAEAEAYKNANINFIRTSHYPASEHLLDACDELGIYVEQETAVCFQGYGTFGNNVYSKYEDYLPQFTEMIERDRNRPSILIWSLGNETNYSNVANNSGGNAIQTERDYLEDVDRSRPCIFSWPNTGEPWELADIYSQHYADVQGSVGSDNKPVLHDEYAHVSCYNIDELKRDTNVRNFWGESVKKAWENIFTSDGALGGALWGGIDDVFYIPEGTQERWQSHSDGPTAGYGEWGSVLDAYLREKPEAYLTKKAYSPVRVDEGNCTIAGDVLNIPVKNWFDHTNLNEVEVEYTAGDETQRIQIEESIEPHSEGVITLPGVSKEDGQINLKFYTADGIMVDEYNIQLSEIQYNFTPASENPPRLDESEDEITVSGGDFEVCFSKDTGMISSAVVDGADEPLITGGPYLHVTGTELGEWNTDGENGLTAEIEENRAVVTMKGSYENGPSVTFRISISGNGIIASEYTLTSDPPTGWGLQEVGISYDVSPSMESVSWKRDGLYSAYPEDHIGRNEGTALKVREGSEENPDQYGKEPEWSWKDDMSNYFIYAENDPDSGLATNDFRAMRENIYYYDVNYGTEEDAARISVESEKADVAARVNLSYDREYVDDRDEAVQYSGSWETYESGSDYSGTETYSTRAGDSCEFTFEGTGVRYIGAKQKNTGKVKVYIDGEFKKEIDTYSDLGNELKQTTVYSIDGLKEGTHTIRLETSGGNAECIVVDAFEVLNQKGLDSEKAQLIINNQWYYPNLAWGNYTGTEGRLYNGSAGSAVIRLDNENNFSENVVPLIENVTVEETEKNTLTVTYDAYNVPEDGGVNLQWYQIKEGDPDSKAEPVTDAVQESLNTKGLEASRVYCRISVERNGIELGSAVSDDLEIGSDTWKYHDVVSDSDEFVFTGTEGTDYQTDRNEDWTQNAYEKTVTYLTDTDQPTADAAEVSFTFRGDGIRWIGAKEENQGIAEVDIDGETAAEVDLYGANITSGTQIGEILFEKEWDKDGEHTITIRRTGEKNPDATGANVNIDAFIVLDREEGETEPEEPSDAADKTGLNLVIAMAEKLETEQAETGCYTEETWAAVQTALDTARALAENADASQEDVDNAFLDLITAVNLLENAVQSVGLQAAIEGAKAILADTEGLEQYTPESVAALKTALAEAERVFAEESADRETINAATRSLLDAVTSLVVVEQDTRLDILIQKAEELLNNSEQYTTASVENLQIALDAAKAVAENGQTSDEEINEAYNNLAQAMTSLVRKAEKSELKTALDKANEILADSGRYVEDTISGLQAATDAAQAVYDKEDADASEVGEAVKSLVSEILKARLLGDVDGNGTVDSADSAEVLKYAAEVQELDEVQNRAADVNRDGVSDSSDAASILQFSAEMITEF